MLVALLLGLLKGAAVGGALGYGAYTVGMDGGWNWITYGLVGVLTGLVAGRTIIHNLRDRNATAVTSGLKAVFGYGVCVGIYALIAKAWGGFDLELMGETRNLYNWQPLMGAAIGGLWGAFLEVDDYDPKRAAAGKGAAAADKKASS